MTNNNLKIAVVDDEKDIQDLYSRIIEKLGYPAPTVFNDGDSFVRNILSGHDSFDVIVMDYRMPGMNGIETIKTIRSHTNGTKIVLATGYDSVREEAEQMGLTFLAKPFSIERLAQSLNGHK